MALWLSATDLSGSCAFVALLGSEAELRERMQQRRHFMPPSLLHSQLETLEVPRNEGSNCILCDCRDPVGEIVAQVVQALGLPEHSGSATEHR